MSVPNTPLYVVTNPAHQAYANAEPQVVLRERDEGRAATRYRGASASLNVGSSLTRADRDFFRPEEEIPTENIEVISACYQAYERFPIIRNVLDMMADFAVKGIDVVNRTPTAQAFGREWAARVGMYERSERIALTLLLAAVCPIRREIGRLPTTFRRPDVAIRARKTNPLRRGQLPTAYTLLDPRDLMPPAWLDPREARLDPLGSFKYAPGLNARGGRTGQGGRGVSPFGWPSVPGAGNPTPLNPTTDRLLFYKRNDYDVLPRPILFSILRDLQVLEKLRMSDVAALDGSTQRLRIFKLGNVEHGIFPTEAAFAKLGQMLAAGVGGGTRDIIWGPDIQMEETETNVHQFLGDAKYGPTMKAIFQGLGVPPTLAGGDPKAGFTNNFVSLRTVVERLQYVRDVLRSFWEDELELVQDALGFRHEFRVVFDEPALSDEAAEKKLLLDLMDRGVISDEAVLERFAADPEIEAIRVRRENKERARGARAPKASQFHLDASQKAQLERTFVQQGELTPSQVGFKYEPPAPGEKTRLDRLEQARPAGGTGNLPNGDPGRPDGAKDSVPRKQKRVVPLKAEARRKACDGLVRPAFLAKVGKTSARQLTAAEAAELEETSFAILCHLGDQVSEAAVAALLAAPPTVPDGVRAAYEAALDEMKRETGEAPTADDRRYLRGLAAAGLLDDDPPTPAQVPPPAAGRTE